MLPATAAKNNGLCAKCANISLEQREAMRRFERELAEGVLFVASATELGSARVPAELIHPTTRWALQPDFYADQLDHTVLEIIEKAKGEVEGHVFLVSESQGELNFGFTRRYAVLEYQSDKTQEFMYARVEGNLRKQVDGTEHVGQACPCCGVGMLWYPSRCHMPRFEGFRLLTDVAGGRVLQGVTWMDLGDFSYTSRGKG
jgi:hypothetical protein